MTTFIITQGEHIFMPQPPVEQVFPSSTALVSDDLVMASTPFVVATQVFGLERRKVTENYSLNPCNHDGQCPEHQ